MSFSSLWYDYKKFKNILKLFNKQGGLRYHTLEYIYSSYTKKHIKNHYNKLLKVNYNWVLYYNILNIRNKKKMFNFFNKNYNIIDFNTFNSEFIPILYQWEKKMILRPRKTIQEMTKVVFTTSDKIKIDLDKNILETQATYFYRLYLHKKRGYDVLLRENKLLPKVITYILDDYHHKTLSMSL